MKTGFRPLLILDLDEVLVHTVESPLPERAPELRVHDYHVYKRPFLDEFLTGIWNHYDVAVWSAGGSGYVEPTVELLMKPHRQPLFTWSFRRCTRKFDHEVHEEYFIKDLKKVRKKGFDQSRMLIVDDTERNCIRNYGNAIYMPPFFGDPEDRELLYLGRYLETLASEPDFRIIEKRGWRERFAGETG